VAAVGFRCGAAVQAVASEERGSCENDVRGRREETRRERDKGKRGREGTRGERDEVKEWECSIRNVSFKPFAHCLPFSLSLSLSSLYLPAFTALRLHVSFHDIRGVRVGITF
jgi:hypothetical protein